MKNTVLFVAALLAHTAYGQNIVNTRTASLVDGDYALEGTVHLELFDDNSLDLRFDPDYLTQTNVFDVHVFLTNDTDYTAPIDTTGMLLVENIGTISGTNYSSGAMTFNLPLGVDINDYDHIVFVCVQFGQLHWGNGVFSVSVATSTTEIDENDALAVSVYPNPSENGIIELQFQNAQQNTFLEVFGLDGQLISSERIVDEQLHMLKLEDAGTYFLKLTSSTGSTVRKVVRR